MPRYEKPPVGSYPVVPPDLTRTDRHPSVSSDDLAELTKDLEEADTIEVPRVEVDIKESDGE